VVALAAISSLTASATVILTTGNVGGQTENVLLSNGTTGTQVTGTVTGAPFSVLFSSTQTLTEPSSGQARVQASSGALTGVTIALSPGFAYQTLIFNPAVVGTVGAASTGTIVVTAAEPGGAPNSTFTFNNIALGNGNNFLTLSASGGEAIIRTAFSATPGVSDIRQVRLTGGAPIQQEFVPTPEPVTMSLISAGLVGIGLIRRRK
jgi:hypothetical protein